MFDINAIVNAAISSAVEQATKPLLERLQGLQNSLERQHEGMVAMRNRITVLENNPAQGVDAPRSFENLDQEFWDKVRGFIDSGIEAGLEEHCSTYDHDSYDSVVSDVEDTDLSNLVTQDSVEDMIRDVINNASFSVSV